MSVRTATTFVGTGVVGTGLLPRTGVDSSTLLVVGSAGAVLVLIGAALWALAGRRV